MSVTYPNAIVLSIAIFITETYAVTCGPCNSKITSKSSEESDYTLESISLGKPLKALKHCNAAWEKTYNAKREGYVPVDCGNCYIYNLSVLAVKKETKGRTKCFGLTAELFSSSQSCMWKNNCNLRYVPAPIVWSPPYCPSCVGEEPYTFDVGYSCLDPGTQIDDVIKGFQTVESEQGLLSSHNYDLKNRQAYPRNLNKHVIDISLPANLSISGKDYYVLLFIVTSNIGQGDKLNLSDIKLAGDDDSNKCEISSWTTGDSHNVSFSTLHFEFTLDSSSGLYAGFDICFQWFEQGNIKAQAVFNETIKLCKERIERTNGFPKFDVIKNSVSQESVGLIRSHSRYPWNYPRPKRSSFSDFQHVWSSHVHVLAYNQLKYVEIEVLRMDVGWGDKLVITDGNGKTVSDRDLAEKSQDRCLSGSNVVFNFSVYDTTISTSSGFLLCYKWSSECPDTNRSTSLCDELTFRVHQCEKEETKENQKLQQKCNLKRKKPGKKEEKNKSGKKRSKGQKGKKN